MPDRTMQTDKLATIRNPKKLAFTVEEAVQATGFPRTSIFDFIRRGEVESFRHGKRRYIVGDSLRALILRLAARESA